MNVLPPPGPQRRRSVLLLLLLVAVIAWMWWPASGPQVPSPPAVSSNTPAQPAAPRDRGGPQGVASDELPQPVNLQALKVERNGLDANRNLFRYGSRPEPPPPPPMSSAPVAQPPPTPPKPQGPPPVPLKLVGRIERPDGVVMVTLKHAETDALFHVTEGAVIDGRYRLVKVGLRSVVVSYLDGTGQRTLAEGGS